MQAAGDDADKDMLLEIAISMYNMLLKPAETHNRRRDATLLPKYMLQQDCLCRDGRQPKLPYWIWLKRETIPPHLNFKRSQNPGVIALIHRYRVRHELQRQAGNQ